MCFLAWTWLSQPLNLCFSTGIIAIPTDVYACMQCNYFEESYYLSFSTFKWGYYLGYGCQCLFLQRGQTSSARIVGGGGGGLNPGCYSSRFGFMWQCALTLSIFLTNLHSETKMFTSTGGSCTSHPSSHWMMLIDLSNHLWINWKGYVLQQNVT